MAARWVGSRALEAIGKQLGSNVLSLWFADGTDYPGQSDIREEIAEAVVLEDMPASLCRAAGEALAAVKGASLTDAVVMASAALRGGGVVYTSDLGDLTRFQRQFSTVRVLPV